MTLKVDQSRRKVGREGGTYLHAIPFPQTRPEHGDAIEAAKAEISPHVVVGGTKRCCLREGLGHVLVDLREGREGGREGGRKGGKKGRMNQFQRNKRADSNSNLSFSFLPPSLPPSLPYRRHGRQPRWSSSSLRLQRQDLLVASQGEEREVGSSELSSGDGGSFQELGLREGGREGGREEEKDEISKTPQDGCRLPSLSSSLPPSLPPSFLTLTSSRGRCKW